MGFSNRRFARAGGFALGLLLASLEAFAAACAKRTEAEPALALLADVMATGRFVAYQPTALTFLDGRPTAANEASIEADLETLRARFDGLITYSSINGAERVADVAARLGFAAVVMGLWDPANESERDNLLAAARRHPKLVVGMSVGNELAFGGRGDPASIARAIVDLRRAAPRLAIATTEPFHLFLRPDWRQTFAEMDFMLPIVHPVFEPWFQTGGDRDAAQFVINVTDLLAAQYCGPILVKESGVPTAPAAMGFTTARQSAFYRELQVRFPPDRARAFAYFSAFDAPWRALDAHPVPGSHPEEAHWGLYDAARNPKPVVDVIPPLPGRW
jgi:exo-beta-1,3-glucanase (GH17 family)